jgi:8-oxo-dGTP pyrophosphatase MutT (NUDIX family)
VVAVQRDELVANLARLERRPIGLDGRRHAAVAVVVVEGADGSRSGSDSGPAVLLTRRSTRLRSHAGQWALPGGRVDPGETARSAVLREVEEEVGLTLPDDSVVGELDDYATRSGYVITPFVLWAGPDPGLEAQPDEVRSIHRVPFGELCREDSPRFIAIPESDRPVVQIPIGSDLIHAPTGAILLQFRRVGIEGTIERVADLEQPVFAWR